MSILLTGGTGTTGSRIASKLLERGYSIRIASRSVPRLAGAEHVPFDWHSGQFPPELFNGIEKLYLVAPVGVLDPLPAVLPFLKKALNSGVKRVVMLGAAIVSDDGQVFGKLQLAVKQLAPEYAILRPSYFMENFLAPHHLHTIKSENKIWSAAGDGKIGFVSADDIAEVGVRALIDQEPHNTSHIITGPEALSYSEAASMIGHAAGTTIQYGNMPLSQYEQAMIQGGLTAEYAGFMTGLEEKIANGAEDRVTNTVEMVTGKKPVSLSEFAEAHREAWM